MGAKREDKTRQDSDHNGNADDDTDDGDDDDCYYFDNAIDKDLLLINYTVISCFSWQSIKDCY